MRNMVRDENWDVKKQLVSDETGRNPLVEAQNDLVRWFDESRIDQSQLLMRSSHKLLSSLATIITYGEIMSDPSFNTNPEIAKKSLETIVSQGKYASVFVENLMTVAMLQIGWAKTSIVPVPIVKLVNEARLEAAGKHHREVTMENRADSVLVPGEPFFLSEAFKQVLDNALKYSPPDAPVHIFIKRREKMGSWVEINVVDHGVGMSAEEVDRIFEPLYRANNETNQRIPGSGLGLYLVKGILQLHKGSAEVKSRLGNGSVVTLILPVQT